MGSQAAGRAEFLDGERGRRRQESREQEGFEVSL
jgi:hypothetical protein